MRAFLFPGQGAQKVGMAKDFYESFPQIKETFDKAETCLGIDIKKIMFNGPEGELRESKNAQVSILLHSYTILNLLKDYVTPDYLAGHSLGEYTAFLAADALSFEDALHLVRFRGELMSMAGEKKPGTMAAIIGLNIDEVKNIVEESRQFGIIIIANFNSPMQFVISGEKEPVTRAIKLTKEKGGKGIPLRVSGAFHSPLIEEVVEPFRKVLSKTEVRTPKYPVFSNVTGDVVNKPDEIRELLAKQIVSSVRWTDIVVNMHKKGVDHFIEMGPGNVLSKLLAQTIKNVKITTISTVDDFKGFVNEIER